ncbi:MAG: tetratricopeptide repeat protein [Myxococcota bacterium]
MSEPGAEAEPAAGEDRSAPRPFTRWAVGIFVLALAVRLAHLWQLRASPFLEVMLGDSATYDAWARTLAAGNWLGDEVFFQAPLYPYFLGTLYATLGDAQLLVRGVQCVLSALACALVAQAGALLFSRGAGIAAGLLLATYAPSIFLDALLQKSVLDLAFVALTLWLAARLSRAPGWGLALALGTSIGGLALARENALILAGVLGLWLLALPGAETRRRLALATVFTAGIGAVLAPIALRNWWIGGELHLTTSQFGANLYIGNHSGAPGGYEPLVPGHGVEHERQDIQELAEQALGRSLTAGEVSDYWTGRVIEYVRSEPGDFARLMGRKLALLVSTIELVDTEDQYATADYSWVLRTAGIWGHFGVLLPLATLGVFVTWPRRRTLWWLHAAIAAYASTLLIFYVVTRYRYPLVPFLALFAGAGIVGAAAWARARPRREVFAALAVVSVLAILSNGLSAMPKDRMRAVTHANLGSWFREHGQLERAVGHYERAFSLDPALDDLAHQLAGTWLEQGRVGLAIGLYERTLATRQDDAGLHRGLARALRAGGRPEPARRHLQRAITLEPAAREARAELAQLELEAAERRLAAGDRAAALAHYRAAAAAQPANPAPLWGAAWLVATQPRTALGDPAEADALAARALDRDARLDPATLEVLAASHAAAGRFAEADARAREALARLEAEGQTVPPRLEEALAHYARGERLRLPAGGERAQTPAPGPVR